MDLSGELMEREKRQRLRSLEIMYFQLYMDLIAYEANEDIAGIEQTKKKIQSCEKSYNAISALKIDEGGVQGGLHTGRFYQTESSVQKKV